MRRSAPRSRVRLTALVFAVVLVTTAAAPAFAATPASPGAVATAGSPAMQQEAPPDPAADRIGWEGGYWHNESIAVDQSDGLSDEELDAYVARGMARVEYIREAEFESTVPVSIITREEYRNRSAGGGANRTAYNRWNDQVWEGLFIVGESTGSSDAIGQTTGSSVAGFYSPTNDAITIVTDSTDAPTINNATLIHELVHALQDQRYDLTNATYRAPTQDGTLAVDGVVEGEANYVETNYSMRCGTEWECVDTPQAGGSGGGGGGPNLGILLTLLNPYSDGPVYVHEIVQEGGWDAFEDRFRNPPVSSEQVIHRTDETPRPIEFTDRETNGWSTFSRDNPRLGQNGSDTVGEASIYAMFWYQAREYRADTINPNGLFDTSSPYDMYNYDAEPSNGWANDRLFPYRNGEGDDATYGYVWITEWDTEADAHEFRDTYLRMLEAHDVRQTDEGYYVVPDGPFADAFLVRLDGDRVTIVNGPTVDDVKNIRPGLEPVDAETTTDGGASPTEPPAGDDTAGDTAGTPAVTTETTGAGFGFGVAVAAVVVAGLLARRRR
ncbi:Hvo_1808 family surface protein [Halobaculum gomorrense]|uniref:PGF-CTERM protein n=1 Tax=Halobaculum gomorrense TaxID=43928 RepID=A0A1M5T5G3_9EURY|nr:Hvo_1808 family surface protein [Halobaculum gomorrense]SHH45936.1 PGF-CTERM protein [Halobaculum gomorrense]